MKTGERPTMTLTACVATAALLAVAGLWGCTHDPSPGTAAEPRPLAAAVKRLETVEELSEATANRLIEFSDAVRRRDFKLHDLSEGILAHYKVYNDIPEGRIAYYRWMREGTEATRTMYYCLARCIEERSPDANFAGALAHPLGESLRALSFGAFAFAEVEYSLGRVPPGPDGAMLAAALLHRQRMVRSAVRAPQN